MGSDVHDTGQGARRAPALCGALGLLLGAVVLTRGWVSDDAFITLRSVGRVLDGGGLTWNPGSRVHVFTHPLWALLLLPLTAITGSGWWGALGAGLLGTGAFAATLVRRATFGAALALALVLASPSFTDFSTSGLENPLLHVLLAALVLHPRAQDPRIGGLIAGLALLTRLDAAPLVGLVLMGRVRADHRWTAIGWAAVPVLGWFAFSLLWFGSLLPNPALAKLGAGLPKAAVIAQGITYLRTSALHDPAGSILLVLGVSVCATRRPLQWAGVGVLARWGGSPGPAATSWSGGS